MVCLLFSYKSYSETLKSKICTDCSFQEAKTLALTIDKPILECFTVSYGGNSMRRCYTKEKKTVLIGNYTNKQVYAFELVHANQGNSSDSHILANSIAYDSVQNQVNSLLDIMEIYQDITNFSNQQKQSVISSIQQTRQYSIQRSESSSNSCDESSIEARAVDLAYDSDVRTTWQREAQNLYDTNPRYAATFKGTKMNGATFTVGTGNFSITGSWVTTDVMPRVEVPLYLNADVPSDAEYIVGYRLSINSGKVKLNLDPLTTYFQGRNLDQWINSAIAATTPNGLSIKLNVNTDKRAQRCCCSSS